MIVVFNYYKTMGDYTRDSSFNMGIAHLTRIDAILYDVASASSEEDFISWQKI